MWLRVKASFTTKRAFSVSVDRYQTARNALLKLQCIVPAMYKGPCIKSTCHSVVTFVDITDNDLLYFVSGLCMFSNSLH